MLKHGFNSFASQKPFLDGGVYFVEVVSYTKFAAPIHIVASLAHKVGGNRSSGLYRIIDKTK